MSLVSTWVRTADGKWYQNPAFYSDSGNWFLCFDDDDPPELVIHQPKQLSKVERVEVAVALLNRWKIKAKILSHTPCGQRIFPPNWTPFKPAISIFIKIKEAIVIGEMKILFDSVSDEMPDGQGCFYKW